MRTATLEEHHASTQSGRAMHQSRRRIRMRATPSLTPPHSPPRLSAFTPTIRLADLRAETLTLGTRLHGTPPSERLDTWMPAS